MLNLSDEYKYRTTCIPKNQRALTNVMFTNEHI